MGCYIPVRAPRWPAGPRGALDPVRLDPCVSVPDTNRDQWALLLAHNHWSRFLVGTGTKESPLVPVPSTNRDQQFSIYTLRPQAEHSSALFFPGGRVWVFVVL